LNRNKLASSAPCDHKESWFSGLLPLYWRGSAAFGVNFYPDNRLRKARGPVQPGAHAIARACRKWKREKVLGASSDEF
jgi:hypothetical protein